MISLIFQIDIFDSGEIWTTASDEYNIGWSWLCYYEKKVVTVKIYYGNRYQQRQSTFKLLEHKIVYRYQMGNQNH